MEESIKNFELRHLVINISFYIEIEPQAQMLAGETKIR